MATLQLDAQPRELVGRKVKQLRRQGLVPVVVYGNVDKEINLQVGERTLERTLHAGGNSQLIELNVEGGEVHNVLMRELQRHPVRRNVLHADFYAINMREKQQLAIPIVSINTPASLQGGLMVLQAMDTVEIEALPGDIPASIEVDISELTLEEALTVADLPVVDGVEYLSDPEEPVFTMTTSRITEEALDDLEEIGEETVVAIDEDAEAEAEGEEAAGDEE